MVMVPSCARFVQRDESGTTSTAEVSVLQGEFVAEDMAAMNLVDGRLAEPALTAHFTSDGNLPPCHRLSKRFAQIKIAADAFGVDAIQSEHRFGVFRIDGVFDLPVLTDTFGAEVCEFHRERLQFPE